MPLQDLLSGSFPSPVYRAKRATRTFSPDGNQLAFAWDGGTGGGLDIWVKLLDTGTPLS